MGDSYRVPSAIRRDRPAEAETQGHGVTMAVSQAGESSVQGWWPGQASVAVSRGRIVCRGSESGNDVPSVVSYRPGWTPWLPPSSGGGSGKWGGWRQGGWRGDDRLDPNKQGL